MPGPVLGQRLSSSQVTIQTHTTNQLLYQDHTAQSQSMSAVRVKKYGASTKQEQRHRRNHTAISADIAHLWPLQTCAI